MPRTFSLSFFFFLFFFSSQKGSEIQLQGERFFTGSHPGPQPAIQDLDSREHAGTLRRRGAAVRVRVPTASYHRLPLPALRAGLHHPCPACCAGSPGSRRLAGGRPGQCPGVTPRARPSALATQRDAVIGGRSRG